MHFVMFGALAGVPSIGLVPSPKLRSFAQDSGVRLIDGPDTQVLREAFINAAPIQRSVTEALRKRAQLGLAECLAAVAR